MRDFRDLQVWVKAHQLVQDVYVATSRFPKEEVYGLAGQMRRSAVSIPANITEGCGRSGEAELGRFCQIAMGSASELEYHVLLSRDLRFLEDGTFEDLRSKVEEVKRMLSSFIVTLRKGS